MPVVPLLAADPGTIIGLIVGALTLLGWILNYANQKQVQPPVQRPNRPVRPPRPADDRLQSEIDVFLEEVRGGRRKLADPHARPVEAARRAEPPAQPAPRTRRLAEGRHLEPKISGQVEPRVGQPRTAQPRMGQRRPAPVGEQRNRLHPRSEQPAGESLRTPAGPLGQAEAAAGPQLGLFTAINAPSPGGAAEAAEAPAGGTLAQQVRTLLREPAGVRQAVLISEILTRPRVGARRQT